MKKDSLYFEGHNPQLIYIAKRLKDATRLESILTEAGIDFGVEADEYYGGVLFRRIRTGAFFYVRPGFYEAALAVLRQHHYQPDGLVDPERAPADTNLPPGSASGSTGTGNPA